MKRKLKPLKQTDYKMRIVKDLGGDKHNPRSAIFECIECGKHETKRTYVVKTRPILYCIRCANHFGQLQHGDSKTRLYKIYYGAKARCENKKLPSYPTYGGRGIRFEFKDYLSFRAWAMSNGYREDLSIDRRDNDGNYSEENCRWATNSVQVSNRNIQVRNKSGFIGVNKIKNRPNYYYVILSYKHKVVFTQGGKDPFVLATARNAFITENNLPHKLTIVNLRSP